MHHHHHGGHSHHHNQLPQYVVQSDGNPTYYAAVAQPFGGGPYQSVYHVVPTQAPQHPANPYYNDPNSLLQQPNAQMKNTIPAKTTSVISPHPTNPPQHAPQLPQYPSIPQNGNNHLISHPPSLYPGQYSMTGHLPVRGMERVVTKPGEAEKTSATDAASFSASNEHLDKTKLQQTTPYTHPMTDNRLPNGARPTSAIYSPPTQNVHNSFAKTHSPTPPAHNMSKPIPPLPPKPGYSHPPESAPMQYPRPGYSHPQESPRTNGVPSVPITGARPGYAHAVAQESPYSNFSKFEVARVTTPVQNPQELSNMMGGMTMSSNSPRNYPETPQKPQVPYQGNSTSAPGNFAGSSAPISPKLAASGNSISAPGNISGVSASIPRNPLEDFLQSQDIVKYLPLFQKEEIDFEILKTLNENELEKLGIPLGPRHKILAALATKSPLSGSGSHPTITSPNQEHNRHMYLDSIEVGKKLGTGNFGEVYQGSWHGCGVALKKLRDPQLVRDFALEADVLLKLRHPNLLSYFGIFIGSNTEQYIVTELMSKGSLLDLVRVEKEKFNLTRLLELAKDVARGLVCLHSYKIIHRDLALRNVLVTHHDGRFTAKVADFGLARETDNYYVSTSNLMPFKWSAPECLKFRKFSSKSDVYAFAILLWELLQYGTEPFLGMNGTESVNFILAGGRPQQPELCSPELWALMNECWGDDARTRPVMEEVYSRLATITLAAFNQQPSSGSFFESVRVQKDSPPPKNYYMEESNSKPANSSQVDGELPVRTLEESREPSGYSSSAGLDVSTISTTNSNPEKNNPGYAADGDLLKGNP